jgi:hypothetical protein
MVRFHRQEARPIEKRRISLSIEVIGGLLVHVMVHIYVGLLSFCLLAENSAIDFIFVHVLDHTVVLYELMVHGFEVFKGLNFRKVRNRSEIQGISRV